MLDEEGNATYSQTAPPPSEEPSSAEKDLINMLKALDPDMEASLLNDILS